MLGGYTWGDSHHPGFSETDGEYDGRWLFINDNANGRIARIDLRGLQDQADHVQIPNISANHGSSFVTPNTEYVTMATRMSVPIPRGHLRRRDRVRRRSTRASSPGSRSTPTAAR